MNLKKSGPTSSEVHVPVAGEETKLKKEAPMQEGDSRMVSKVAIYHEGKILLGERSDNHDWDFPGGRAKEGEDPIDAAIRETLEETGIQLDPDRLILVAEESYEKNDKGTLVAVSAYAYELTDEEKESLDTTNRDDEFDDLIWAPVSPEIPQEVLDRMHVPMERNILLQAISDATEEAQKQDIPDESEPNALSELQDAQELISGIDWEVEQANVDPLTARELAWDNLDKDPLHYRKLRLAEDGTDDALQKDTGENESSPFEGSGFNDDVVDRGFWVDIGSGHSRESGHIGLDLYPYDHGTAVHDVGTGLPFPDGSVSKIRCANVLDGEGELDPKPLLADISRVLTPGGFLHYEGPNDIYNYPDWLSDSGDLVLVDHSDDEGIHKGDAPNVYRQTFQKIATPDPATANDAEPRIGINQYDMLPADALLQMDATGYFWSDATSSGRGNRLMGYPSQGALLNKGMGASSQSSCERVLSDKPMFKSIDGEAKKGGPGSGRHSEGGGKLERAQSQHVQTQQKLQEARSNYGKAPRDKKEQARAELRQAMVDHQASRDNLRYHSKKPVQHELAKILPILKSSMKQVVFCIVLEPDTADAQDDIMTSEDIEETAHNYMIKARMIGASHTQQIEAAPVESFIAPQDLEYQGQNGPQVVKKGSWVIGIKVFDQKEWQKVLNGEYTGVSVGGKGLRDEI